MTYISHSAEETRSIAKILSERLKGGEFISLIGDLGAGKTTFVQGLVEGLGGGVRVKSPTFTVMNVYAVNPPKNGIARVVHVDFYRFTKEEELQALSLEDEKRSDTVIIAEWPNIFARDLFSPDIKITLSAAEGENDREIVISP